MAYTSLNFSPYTAGIVYSQFDVVNGAYVGDLSNTYYYSTQANNVNNQPNATYVYNVTSYSRYQDVATVIYTYTGGPFFGIGSIVTTSMTPDITYNFTGMITAGGSGTISYPNQGWDEIAGGTAGTITCNISPAWTTGFMFVPSYSTQGEFQQNVISAQFEPGYEQRQASSINPNTNIWSLAFLDRTAKELRAIRNFTQNMAGVYSFPIMMTDSQMANQPNQKFVTVGGLKWNNKSYNLNDIQLQVKQVFDM